MGTVASIATVTEVTAEVRAFVEAACQAFDDRFSLYQATSELSRLNAGEFKLTDASDELRAAYAVAMDWSVTTAGAFSPERPDGTLDLNGVVKALAIAECCQLLKDAGVEAGHVGIGGDGECWGEHPGDEGWLAGIADPADSQRIISTTSLGEGRWALATSGSAERGDHIWTRPGITPPIQASVIAPDIVTADVLATAIISGGLEFANEVLQRWPISVCIVTSEGEMLQSEHWAQ